MADLLSNFPTQQSTLVFVTPLVLTIQAISVVGTIRLLFIHVLHPR